MEKEGSKISYYPVALNLKHRLALVAGGGEVAERKVKTLLQAGASVAVISPALTKSLERLYKGKRIIWHKKKVSSSDIDNATLVIAATSKRAVNRQVSHWAKKKKVLVNVVDKPALSTFISPALLFMPQATVAVYTNGKNPALSRDLKNFLKEHWDVFLSYRDRL